MTSPLASNWGLDPAIDYLNHGSFGACPLEVLAHQRELRDRLEREAVRFFVEELEPMLDDARAEVATFIGAQPQDLVFVTNATVGVNAVLRSLEFKPGDELLSTNQDYNACLNAMRYAAERCGATPVIAELPFPIRSPDDAFNAIMSRVTPRTRLLMVSHITSPTAIILPVERLVKELNARGIDTLVDGAHAPGMVPVNVDALGAAYYTANCHKWMCAPKGAGILHVRPDRQHLIRPTVISHGANSRRADRSRFLMEFDWTGTADPTPYLCIPAALRCMAKMVDGGWPEIRRRNRDLVLRGRDILCAALSASPAAPAEMIGSIASVRLPDAAGHAPTPGPNQYHDPFQNRLIADHRVQVPIFPWPQWPTRWIRISGQLYNSIDQYERLGAALKKCF